MESLKKKGKNLTNAGLVSRYMPKGRKMFFCFNKKDFVWFFSSHGGDLKMMTSS